MNNSKTEIVPCKLSTHTFKILNETEYINIKDVPDAIKKSQFSLGQPFGNTSFGKKWPLTFRGKPVKIIIKPEGGCQLLSPYGLSKLPVKEGFTGETFSIGIRCYNESGMNETHEQILTAFDAIRTFVVGAIIKQPAAYLGRGSVSAADANFIIPSFFKFSNCIKDNCKIPDEEANKRTLYVKAKNFDNAKTSAMTSIAKQQNISDQLVNKILMNSFASTFYDISRVVVTTTRISDTKRRKSTNYLQVSPVDSLYEVSDVCAGGMKIHHIVLAVEGVWSAPTAKSWQIKVLEVHFEPHGGDKNIAAGTFDDVEEEDEDEEDDRTDLSEISM